MGEVAELRHGQGGAVPASGDPPLDVLFRPEEVHGASREDDVVPPLHSGDEAMEHERGVVWLPVADLDGDL